jgi:hypothetical protein
MKLPRRKFLHLTAGAAALPVLSRFAWAQAYPSRPVRIIVPIAPAGSADIVARLIGQWLSERLGHQFVIDNRPGAGSNIAAEAVVRAPADGYTLLLITSTNAINTRLYDKLNFNFIRDIEPVASLLRTIYVMAVKSGQDQYGIGWHWERSTYLRRAIQNDDGRRFGAGTLKKSLRGIDALINTYWIRFDNPPHFTFSQALANSKVLFDAAKRAGVGRVVHISITNPDCRFRKQPLLKFLIDPRLGDNSGPIVRADFFLVGLDQKIERNRFDIALLGENALKSAHTQLYLR